MDVARSAVLPKRFVPAVAFEPLVDLLRDGFLAQLLRELPSPVSDRTSVR